MCACKCKNSLVVNSKNFSLQFYISEWWFILLVMYHTTSWKKKRKKKKCYLLTEHYVLLKVQLKCILYISHYIRIITKECLLIIVPYIWYKFHIFEQKNVLAKADKYVLIQNLMLRQLIYILNMKVLFFFLFTKWHLTWMLKQKCFPSP